MFTLSVWKGAPACTKLALKGSDNEKMWDFSGKANSRLLSYPYLISMFWNTIISYEIHMHGECQVIWTDSTVFKNADIGR